MASEVSSTKDWAGTSDADPQLPARWPRWASAVLLDSQPTELCLCAAGSAPRALLICRPPAAANIWSRNGPVCCWTCSSACPAPPCCSHPAAPAAAGLHSSLSLMLCCTRGLVSVDCAQRRRSPGRQSPRAARPRGTDGRPLPPLGHTPRTLESNQPHTHRHVPTPRTQPPLKQVLANPIHAPGLTTLGVVGPCPPAGTGEPNPQLPPSPFRPAGSSRLLP